MKEFYRRLFYHIYKSLLKNDTPTAAKSVAIGVLSTIMNFNIMVIFSCLDLVLVGKLDFLFEAVKKKEIGIPMLLLTFLFNFLIFPSRSQDETILEYSDKPLEERKKGAQLTLAYGLGSVALVFVFGYLRTLI